MTRISYEELEARRLRQKRVMKLAETWMLFLFCVVACWIIALCYYAGAADSRSRMEQARCATIGDEQALARAIANMDVEAEAEARLIREGR